MSIATVLWLVAVSSLVTGVAGAAAAALRHLHRPERGVWFGALLVTMALPLIPAPSSVGEAGTSAAAVGSITQVVTLATSSLPQPARESTAWVPVLWGAASLLTLAALLGGAWSLSRRRETWPRQRIDGDLLRVSEHFGPAVVGWIDPEIVVPQWVLDLEPRQRRLIVQHENEHRWARDTQLLALGVICLAATPWNPLAWLQFRGLRRAIEFDCDARVLRSGASPRAYGRLLLSVQLDAGRGALFAPALREPAYFLERRLKTMKLRDRPVARIRVAGLALTAAVFAVVACETPRPVAPETAAEASVASELLVVEGAESAYAGVVREQVGQSGVTVRGRAQFDADECVEEAPADAAAETGTLAPCGSITERSGVNSAFVTGENVVVEATAVYEESEATLSPGGTTPLIIIDGVRIDAADGSGSLSRLSPSDIDRIEVIKGTDALEEYGSGGADGVIRIFTKNGGN